jgi:cadmium resistance protein CadD (predicted permease)
VGAHASRADDAEETLSAGLVGQAAGLFAVTNVDSLVLLALFFGQTSSRGQALRVVAGQYLGFMAILAVSVAGALGASRLPKPAIAYLGLIPLALGLRAAWRAWRERHDRPERVGEESAAEARAPGMLTVAGVTVASGGDNIGVYIPVFAESGTRAFATYVVVFLVLVGVWCAGGYWFARRRAVAQALSRWGHVIVPAVLITIGVLILVYGHAFGL